MVNLSTRASELSTPKRRSSLYLRDLGFLDCFKFLGLPKTYYFTYTLVWAGLINLGSEATWLDQGACFSLRVQTPLLWCVTAGPSGLVPRSPKLGGLVEASSLA